MTPAADSGEALEVSPSDPLVTIAGIRQFGLASDGSDLRDLATAIDRLAAELAAAKRERDEAERDGYAPIAELKAYKLRAETAEAAVVSLRNERDGAWEALRRIEAYDGSFPASTVQSIACEALKRPSPGTDK